MFAFQWREFSPPLSSAHRLLQCYHRQKRDRRRCNSRVIPPQPLASRVITQWASSLEWRHAVTLHILVGKICITFFLFYWEGMLPLVVLWWLCEFNKVHKPQGSWSCEEPIYQHFTEDVIIKTCTRLQLRNKPVPTIMLNSRKIFNLSLTQSRKHSKI